MRGLISVLIVGLAACGGPSLRSAGESCTGSSECAAGLVCDFGMNPPVCATMSTVPDATPADQPDAPPGSPDARIPRPDAMPGTPDAGGADATLALPDAAIPDATVPIIDATVPSD